MLIGIIVQNYVPSDKSIFIKIIKSYCKGKFFI